MDPQRVTPYVRTASGGLVMISTDRTAKRNRDDATTTDERPPKRHRPPDTNRHRPERLLVAVSSKKSISPAVNPALVMLWAKEISAAANGMAVQEEDSLVPLSWCSSHIARKVGKSSERVGHARYSRLLATLDEFYLREGGSVSKEPIVRSDIQRIFHRHMLNACLPVIYGAEFETCVETILKDNGWDEVKQEVLVVTCRREGKTMAVSLLVAGLLICVPYIKVVVFAVGMRTALQLVSRVESLCESHAIGSGMIVRPHAKELLVMRNRQDRTDTRSLMALPCNSKVPTSLPLHTLTPVHLRVSASGVFPHVCACLHFA